LPTSRDLQRQTREFAARLNTLLNGTVVNGPRLTPVTKETGDRSWIGYGISKENLVARAAMALTIDQSPPRLFLHVYQILELDESGQRLTTARSEIGLWMDREKSVGVCRYEYERDKADGYPECHVHFYGRNGTFEDRFPERQMVDLHFPLGDRRFRASLEDVIEFLIREGLVAARPGWEDVVRAERDYFYANQLEAAARRDPDAALRGIESRGRDRP
jgi:hypothetical protein